MSTIFAKKDPSWIFDWFLNALLVAMVFFLFIATVGNITENGFFHGCSQPAFQQWKQQSNVWNLFKINNKDQNDVKAVTLVSLLLTLNRINVLFRCFNRWSWTSKYRLGCPWSFKKFLAQINNTCVAAVK